jgi:hypothetical protein
MNRDRISFSQKETQAEVKLMQSIRPQIYIDQHGQRASGHLGEPRRDWHWCDTANADRGKPVAVF